MKVITFFSEKGGTGKTTLTVLMASYLAYKKHENVCVMDCDFPSYQFSKMRETDIAMRLPENPAFLKAIGSNIPYPVGKIAAKERFTPAEMGKIADALKAQTKGDGYYFLDFPGRFLPDDLVYYLSRKGLIDLVVLPVDSDRQSRASALYVADVLRSDGFKKATGKRNGQDMCVLWNREATKERQGKRDWYAGANDYFSSIGIPVVSRKVRDILIARRDPNTFGFIRSTLCWPEQNVHKAAPYLESIFEEIKLRADGKWNDRMRRKLYPELDNY